MTDRPDELPGKIVAAIDRLARGQRAHRQAMAEAHGLTLLQSEILRVLADGVPPEPVVGLLANEVAVSQPTLTESVNALQRKGLVERGRDDVDRRRTRLALTRRGDVVVRALVEGDQRLADGVARLGAREQATTLETLLTLIGHMVESGTISVARTCFTCRFHAEPGPGRHHCTLLGTALPAAELRVNCPEHEPAAPREGHAPHSGPPRATF